MASRLDRLVTIIETGSTRLIRNTAVDQLAEWQKKQPTELFNLLSRVVPYLRHKEWETRSTAARAVGKIVENAPLYDPNADGERALAGIKEAQADQGVVKEEDRENGALEGDDRYTLETLDMHKIVKYGRPLLRGGTKTDHAVSSLDPQARLRHQTKTLKGRLGLLGRLWEDDEMAVDSTGAGIFWTPDTNGSGGSKVPSQKAGESGLSSRQLNVLKRKRKREAQKAAQGKSGFGELSIRRATTASDGETADADSNTHGRMAAYLSLDRPADVNEETKVVSAFKGAATVKSELEAGDEAEGAAWPFERLCEILKADLFDSSWETRHGAAMGLREITRVHGGGAGRAKARSRAANDAQNRAWLDDLSCRLCCVLVLDKFTDYSSDTLVAPIRETVGQTLGSALRHVGPEMVGAIYRLLYGMVMQDDLPLEQHVWAICHGGMVGLRYVVAVRKDVLLRDGDMIDGVLRTVTKGLGDADDDVRSVSAATLIPMAGEVVVMRPAALEGLMHIVWESLAHLGDDLSASTGKMMDLLATLCGFPPVLAAMTMSAAHDADRAFGLLVPRLYPFLRHTITSVRLAVLKALMTFAGLGGETGRGWLDGWLLRLVLQNMLVERDPDTLAASLELWSVLVARLDAAVLGDELAPHVAALLRLTLHPIGVSRHPEPMDATLFHKPSGATYGMAAAAAVAAGGAGGEHAAKRRRKSAKSDEVAAAAHDVDGHMMQGDVDLVGMDTLVRGRLAAAKALGLAMARVPAGQTAVFAAALAAQLASSPFASTQLTAAVVADELATHGPPPDSAAALVAPLLHMMEAARPACYRDLVSDLQRVRAQCQQLIHLFRDLGKVPQTKLPVLAVVVQGEAEAGPGAFCLAHADKVVSDDFDRLKKAMAPGQRMLVLPQLHEARDQVVAAIRAAAAAKAARDVRLRAAAAAALVALGRLPKKPSPLIKAVMDSVKTEANRELQARSAATIARLVRLLADAGRRAPVDKVVANLAKFSCVEVADTPEFPVHAHKTLAILSMHKEEDCVDHADAAQFAREAQAARITRRGARLALELLAQTLGARLLAAVPSLRSLMAAPLARAFAGALPPEARDASQPFGQEIVDALSVMRTMAPTLHAELRPFVLQQVPLVLQALRCDLSVFRYMAAKCLATVCSVMTVDGMTALVDQVLPSVNDAVDLAARQGAIEAIYHLMTTMGDAILPYVIFLVVPVLGRMSDSDSEIRLMATTSFAALVKLVPLEAGIPDPPGLSRELLHGRDRERAFIGQLLDPKKVEPFPIPVAIRAQLRSYQQDGVNWLHFLNKYHLHGILCDDMGLGKTLQTICVVASDHHARARDFAATRALDARHLPSLIVCPPTLSGHWAQEIKTYAPFLSLTSFVGSPANRKALAQGLDAVDMVITSYDVCRNDADVLERYRWNYVVLDEGHLIKNPRAKISIAVKRLASNHRLILTGTPIQNNVLELWSLFDFLMPGFLGAEKVFLDRFAKPIANSRHSKASAREQEAGALAIEALHKQVLPFLLRRLKEEVLDDLPPKILQNYYCDLSDLQRKLFEDFSRREARKMREQAGRDDKEAKQHIFQALQYMRKLCNSPALVMKPGHRAYEDTQRFLAAHKTSLADPVHAPKLMALRDLLVDCGIGLDGPDPAGGDPLYTPIKPHRALIFCQMKEMLDMVQTTVLGAMLPSVSYLRLDGGVEAARRQDIVNTFNSDPSYDCLLLTTSVGGLGLNLTGADTVIFVEHDWNPQKDLQAMDRAHRIGQKKVVNVYRLITRGTLEEKILSLQRFKMDVASTVVNQQNAGLSTMDTDQILDLFSFGDGGGGAGPDMIRIQDKAKDAMDGREEDMVDVETGEVRQPGKKAAWLHGLGELWDDRQYEESFDLDGFLKTMR